MASPDSKLSLLKELNRYERQNHELRQELQSCSLDLKDAECLNSQLSQNIQETQDATIDEALARCLVIVADILDQSAETDLDRKTAVHTLVSKLEVLRSRFNRQQTKLTDQQEQLRRSTRDTTFLGSSAQTSAERIRPLTRGKELQTPTKATDFEQGDTDKPMRTRTASQRLRVQVEEPDSVLNSTISFGSKRSPRREFSSGPHEEVKKAEPKRIAWNSIGSSQSPKDSSKRASVTRDVGQYLERFTRLKASTLNFSTLRARP
jgi:hypothetical protein